MSDRDNWVRVMVRYVPVAWSVCLSLGETLCSGCCCRVLTATAMLTGVVLSYRVREYLTTWCNLPGSWMDLLAVRRLPSKYNLYRRSTLSVRGPAHAKVPRSEFQCSVGIRGVVGTVQYIKFTSQARRLVTPSNHVFHILYQTICTNHFIQFHHSAHKLF